MIKIIGVLFCFFSCFYGISQKMDEDCACCTQVHTQFDFWVGSWETYNPDNTLAGNNIIEKIQDNCILRENWTSSSGGYTGTSYNFYNLLAQQWEQIWIDNGGQTLHLKGNLVDGSMILSSDKTRDLKGHEVINRITWTPNDDGSVRQLWEVLNVSENKWTIAFDGLYKKTKI